MYYGNFERLCKQKNVTPSQVSKATGIATSTLTNWKKGEYTPKSDKLKLIADYFGVTLEYIVTGEEQMKKTTDNFLITDFERKIIEAFRSSSQQSAVCVLLGLQKEYELENESLGETGT